jgi:hypothetical protein
MDPTPARERAAALLEVIGKGLGAQGIYGQPDPDTDEHVLTVDVGGRDYEIIVRPKSVTA